MDGKLMAHKIVEMAMKSIRNEALKMLSMHGQINNSYYTCLHITMKLE